jgi:metal-responsive CopG/Arc/MetJ family transcriptional regulator
MPGLWPKTLISWDDTTLLADITVEAEISGTSRSEWIREACRQRLARIDAEAAQVTTVAST